MDRKLSGILIGAAFAFAGLGAFSALALPDPGGHFGLLAGGLSTSGGTMTDDLIVGTGARILLTDDYSIGPSNDDADTGISITSAPLAVEIFANGSGLNVKATEIIVTSPLDMRDDISINGANQIWNDSEALCLGSAACTTSHALTTTDFMTGGAFEANGIIYADGGITTGVISAPAGVTTFGGVIGWTGSGATDTVTHANPSGDQFVFGMGTDDGIQFIIAARGVYNKNFDHAEASNPFLYVQSSTDPDTANDEWVGVTHDVTDAIISTGSGRLVLAPAALGLEIPNDNSSATPAEPVACASGTFGTMTYVNDTDDTAVSALCICGQQADDSTYDWLLPDGTACPFF